MRDTDTEVGIYKRQIVLRALHVGITSRYTIMSH